MMIKPKIEIWDSVGLGIIIKYPSGVLVSNQTGGTACFHPSLEGVYLPIHNDYHTDSQKFISPENEFSRCFTDQKYNGSGAQNGIDEEDLIRLERLLKKFSLDGFIKINKNKLQESHEAWIHILINEEKQQPFTKLVKGFEPYPREGILTWANSD